MWKRRKAKDADAHETYEALGDRYASGANAGAALSEHERPGTRALIGDVKGLRVLDAGCGPGWWVVRLLEDGAEGVTGVDAASSMIEAARRQVGSDRRVDLREHDLREPLTWMADESLDLVVSSLVLAHLADWSMPLSEFHRLLRPGGRFVFSIEHPGAEYMRPGKGGYFARERIKVRWRTGQNAEAPSFPVHRRPLQAVTDALIDAGFRVERLLEPQPTDAYREREGETRYQRCRSRPVWLCLAAQKPRAE